jgi:ribosome-associated translation inhibitor RaiA
MPSYSQHPVSSRTKLLLVGDSGAGKTAMLAGLANAGYELFILDFDDGLDILSSYLNKDAVDRVHYETLRDDLGKAEAFGKTLKLLDGWVDSATGEDFGPIDSWDAKRVLVVDSVTFLADAAMRKALRLNGKRPTDKPSQPDWYDAGRDVEEVIKYITSDNVKCNVVCNTHLLYMEDATGSTRAYPVVLGNKLPTKVGRYFNTICRIDVKPSKSGEGTRTLRTASDFKMDLKNTAPNSIDVEAEADLAKLFAAIKKNAEKTSGQK